MLGEDDRLRMTYTLPATKFLRSLDSSSRRPFGNGVVMDLPIIILGGIGKHSLGGLIPTPNDSVEVFANDGVARSVDDHLAFEFNTFGNVSCA